MVFDGRVVVLLLLLRVVDDERVALVVRPERISVFGCALRCVVPELVDVVAERRVALVLPVELLDLVAVVDCRVGD